MMPQSKFRIWRYGIGLTKPSRFFVRKSKKNLGQKKPSIEAAIWSVGESVSLGNFFARLVAVREVVIYGLFWISFERAVGA
jgi:hypothetical protein